MVLYYAVVAGTHASLPFAELKALLDIYANRYRILVKLSQLVVFESDRLDLEKLVSRAGFVEEVGVVLACCDADPKEVLDCVRSLEPLSGVYRVEFRRLRGFNKNLYDDAEFKGLLVKTFESSGWRLSPTRYTGILRVIVEEGFAVIGVLKARLVLNELRERWPHKRPFYKPGALDPRMARLFVNLARTSEGDVYLDPFCGTGGFAVEALLSAGVRAVLCGDVDRDMSEGSKINLEFYTRGLDWVCIRWDARRLPLRDDSVDSIGTDPPYGRLTTTAGLRLENILESFLWEASRVLRDGRFVSFACPHWLYCSDLAKAAGLCIVERHYMRVHGSLTREVIVAQKV